MAKLGDATVGSSVFLNISGTPTEFLVVHQGLPSSDYDSSCDGTWVLMKDIYTTRAYDSTDNDYANSSIKTWLNGTFFNKLDADMQSMVLQVKIPYIKGVATSESAAYKSGANGLSAKVFLLSGAEVSNEKSYFASSNVYQGAILDYFSPDTLALRIAYYKGTATIWFLRGPFKVYEDYASVATETGRTDQNRLVTTSYGIRPAMILDPSLCIDSEGNLIAANINGYTSIGGTYRELDSGYANVDGAWRSIIGSFKNIDGTEKE